MKQLVYIGTATLLTTMSARPVTVNVNATDNIFGAGHLTAPAPSGGGGGTLPASFNFHSESGQIIVFTDVSGLTRYGNFVPDLQVGPDGGPAAPRDVSSSEGIAGNITPTRFPLLGLFLDDAEPLDPAPPRLDFTDSGLGVAFDTLSPSIGQTFFIGDGLTGTGTGELQKFNVPTTATRLFLGFADSHGDPGDGPGYYFDNSGFLTVSLSIVPEPSAGRLLALGVGGLSLARRMRPGRVA